MAKHLGPGDHCPPHQRVWVRCSLHCECSLDHELKQLWEFHVLPGKKKSNYAPLFGLRRTEGIIYPPPIALPIGCLQACELWSRFQWCRYSSPDTSWWLNQLILSRLVANVQKRVSADTWARSVPGKGKLLQSPQPRAGGATRSPSQQAVLCWFSIHVRK